MQLDKTQQEEKKNTRQERFVLANNLINEHQKLLPLIKEAQNKTQEMENEITQDECILNDTNDTISFYSVLKKAFSIFKPQLISITSRIEPVIEKNIEPPLRYDVNNMQIQLDQLRLTSVQDQQKIAELEQEIREFKTTISQLEEITKMNKSRVNDDIQDLNRLIELLTMRIEICEQRLPTLAPYRGGNSGVGYGYSDP